MSDLIDRTSLAEHKFPSNECNGFGEGPAYRQGWNDAIDAIIDNAPSAEPVRMKGKWIPTDTGARIKHFFKCSLCGSSIDTFCINSDINYCPNCGSHMMRGEEDEQAKHA